MKKKKRWIIGLSIVIVAAAVVIGGDRHPRGLVD